ncbi:hypothetical protein H6F76_03010 [Leptolyngbya sp. FACHB-321]|uniref:hypothetical protein n=1 Tax=Leptolyngbya sp. FACHB-321 TaxID=2692807 RepID=UPI001687033B|nr:hypothetical protein [Leptolyngbya sp. FACHB-321]MBD2034020.1 hypothetical protein [Leptolyngbya sp. FACHB-321]
MVLTTLPKQLQTRAKHTRLVSFENSNSFLKRHDSEGTLVIQAGYRENPSDSAHADDENPIVILNGTAPRWYGSIACQGQHIRSFERSKLETAREAFAACLRPSDDGRDLIVVASYWDRKDLPAMERALLGTYNVIRNGESICCTVTQVLTVVEGIGSYWAVESRLQHGQTFLLEIGFRTAEEWLIDETGRVIDGRPVTQLGIFNLVNAIANDATVRATLSNGDRSDSINLSLISAGLQRQTIGRLAVDQWQAIKTKYASEYLKSLKGYLRTQYASIYQSTANSVLTGGGAALLLNLQPRLSDLFVIPQEPQTASVRGSYARQLSKVGV